MYHKGLVLLNDWTHFILESSTHPTRILLWVIVILIVLFLLSRTHNILEEKSVNQAIRISRGLVSCLLVFIIGPIVAFLILTANLRVWSSTLLALLAVPLSIGANGLRIALIGWIGNSKGDEIAAKSHEASGWVVLVVCFLLLAFLTRLMEVKK